MRTFKQDLRFAVRALMRRPALSLLAILAIALGVGANTAIFSVFDAVLLDPLPYPEADRLVRIWETNQAKEIARERPSPVTFHDFREQNESFAGLTGWWHPDLNLTTDEGEPERVAAINATDDFFDVLGTNPILGRGFLPGEDERGKPQIAVIGYAAWQRHFGGAADVLDRTVQLDGVPYSIVGVMPPGFDFPDKTEIWLPLGWDPAQHSRGARFFGVVGRLQPSVELAAAQAELDTLFGAIEHDHPESNAGWETLVVPLANDVVGNLRPALWILLGAVAFVLLIACANVANLLLAQALAREQEVALRIALGAGRGRILRQFLTESLCLGAIGGLMGLAFAWIGVRVLLVLAPTDLPRLDGVGIDARVLGFTLGLAVLASLIFGLIPAWQAGRADFVGALKEGARGVSSSAGSRRLRQALVIAEVALAVVLLAGAGLLIRSFAILLDEHPGFNAEQTLSFNLQLPRSTYANWTDATHFYSTLLERLQTRPGVRQAAVTGFLPLEAGWRVDFQISGVQGLSDAEQPEAQVHPVSPGYFQLLGIPLQQGRDFTDRDTADKPGVVVLNRAAVDRYFAEQSPVGEKVVVEARQFGPLGRILTENLEVEVIGIVGDAKNTGLEAPVEPAMYFPQRQFAYRSMNVLTRTSGNPEAMMRELEATVWELDASLPIAALQTLDGYVGTAVAERRFVMQLLSGFAALALALALIGTYGVMAYTAGQRHREVGIRMALGALRGDVVRLLVKQGLCLTLSGLGIGLVTTWWLRPLLASLVFGVGTSDLLTLGAVTLLITAAALVACYLPARRAARIDPVQALRTD